MGLGLSLRTVAHLARVTVPSFVEAMTGNVSREAIDARALEWSRGFIERARVRLEVRGLDQVPRGRAFVYMSNHQSHLDIPMIYATVPAQSLRMVAKTELFKIPVWGQAMRGAGFIEVDRRDKARSIASINRAAEQIASGVSIWIAPEGTRSTSGEIAPMKKGGFHLAINTGTPIVPLAIDGTRHILPKGGRSMRYDVPVTVTYGAPIDVDDRTVAELADEVRDFLQGHVL